MQIDIIRKDQNNDILAIVVDRRKCYVTYGTTYGETKELFKFFKIHFCENLEEKLKSLKEKICI